MLESSAHFGRVSPAPAVLPLIENLCSQRKECHVGKIPHHSFEITIHSFGFLAGSRLLAVALQIGPAKPLAAAELPNFADLVERNAPSIVEISTIRRMAARSPVADSELEELLRRINPVRSPIWRSRVCLNSDRGRRWDPAS